VTEWRLWEGEQPPEFTELNFFRTHPRIDPGEQVGHAERTAMAVQAVVDHREQATGRWLIDLGCGDGSFLDQMLQRVVEMAGWWMMGYDAGEQNVAEARKLGLDVEREDFLDLVHERGAAYDNAVVTLNEVLEHLADPHLLLGCLRAGLLVCTSPLAEDADWHYEHHAWAWDRQGYEDLLNTTGWEVLDHRAVAATRAVRFPPSYDERVPSYQCIVARRAAR